jgi:glutathione transport system permease protein
MLAYFLRRLVGTVPVLVAVSIFVFGFVHLLPGDPARLIAGPDASQQDVQSVREALGLDRPLWQQYLRYVDQTMHGEQVDPAAPVNRSRRKSAPASCRPCGSPSSR